MYNNTNLFETIRDRFNSKFQFSLISNIILYRNDRGETDLYANEVDHLFHYKTNGKDHLVIIEVKQRRLFGNNINQMPTSNGPWTIDYDGKIKDIKKQAKDQVAALKQFCYNVSKIEPIVECWVVDLREDDKSIIVDSENNYMYLLTLSGFGHKFDEVDQNGFVIRVEHSDFLRELRRGIICPELGHPEIPNGVRFIKICRKSLDDQIYRYFHLKHSYYALNGCAGSGKSVLLGYCIFVFASDYAVNTKDSTPILEPLKEIDKSKLPKFSKRKIYVCAVKNKQVDSLKFYWQEIKNQLSKIAKDQPVLQQPVFKQWNGIIPGDCTILVVDEAHDLTIEDQNTIAKWINQTSNSEINKFLLVACDRNQSIKKIEKNENIIYGLNFSQHATRLNRIYRCPFPVYVASIGILFRWFAPQGANIELSNEKLREHFGFMPKVKDHDNCMFLTMRNDCHPGNNWNQTVGYFNNCSNAYLHLKQFTFERKDVLWACFERIEKEFDYTEIQKEYTFVDLKDADAGNEIDKYIKGQEFSIVVVEGLPPNINPQELVKENDWGKDISELEQKMWIDRKSVYIVCSRATAFLYFIYDLNVSTTLNGKELKNLIEQVSNPFKGRNESGQTWEFKINKPLTRRKPDLFQDVENANFEPLSIVESIEIPLQHPTLTVDYLSEILGASPDKIQDILPEGAKAKINKQEFAVKLSDVHLVAEKMGKKITIGKTKQENCQEPPKKTFLFDKMSNPKPIETLKSNHTQQTVVKKDVKVHEKKILANKMLPYNGDYTNKKISKIILFDKTYCLETWGELLLHVSGTLFSKHKDEFQKCLSLQGNKRQYFSKNSKDLKAPKRIKDSMYFVETNENANSIVRRCRDLMSLFRYKERDLDIYVI